MKWHSSCCLVIILSAAALLGQQFPQLQELVESGKLQQASQIVESELEQRPGHPELLYWKAVVQWRRGESAQASATLQALVSEKRAQPPHLLLLGAIYDQEERFQEAAGVYRLSLSKADSPRTRMALGLAEFRAGEYGAAVETLRPLSSHPQAPAQLHHLLGVALLGANQLPEAAQELAKAVAMEPGHAGFHYDYGLALLQGDRLPGALEQFSRSTELDPGRPEGWLYLGRALHDSNLGDDALEAFRKAQLLDPKLPLLEHHFGLLFKGRGDYEVAIRHFETELNRGRRHPPTLFHLAEILDRRQQRQRSAELVAEAIRLQPDNAEYRLLAAKQAMRSGELEEADKHLEMALEADPDSSPAYYQLGQLRQRQGRRDESRAAFERSRQLADERSRRGGNP